MQPYNAQFYDQQKGGSRRSAQAIVPLVLRLVRPRHVVDVGCGVATWLSVFMEQGCVDVVGIDGDYVDRKSLLIPAERFLTFDLTQPLRLERQFDLVVSLEVAEHLPPECAETFIDSLTRLGPVVLFSAAIPFQGGVHHVNEQWPDYWARYFQARGFVVLDPIRRHVWNNEQVEYFYAQNILMFARRDVVEGYPGLRSAAAQTATAQLSLVHPQRYLETQRLLQAIQDIATIVSPQDLFILVDGAQLDGAVSAGRRVLPFLERDGQYWGPPPDDFTAIRELERLREAGARFVAFAWPAFWWLDHYAGFHQYLRTTYPCVLENDRLVVFSTAERVRTGMSA